MSPIDINAEKPKPNGWGCLGFLFVFLIVLGLYAMHHVQQFRDEQFQHGHISEIVIDLLSPLKTPLEDHYNKHGEFSELFSLEIATKLQIKNPDNRRMEYVYKHRIEKLSGKGEGTVYIMTAILPEIPSTSGIIPRIPGIGGMAVMLWTNDGGENWQCGSHDDIIQKYIKKGFYKRGVCNIGLLPPNL
ncbi:MAG: hypothetical protein HQL69_21070 [Magnetococcales bacterium]|nr:hypothetical protein [Magnetococcales bacterium]